MSAGSLAVSANGNAERPSWVAIMVAPATVRRSLRVAAVVGSILVAINYGSRILAGALEAADFARIGLTYCVPYCVATYAAVSALRGQP